MMIFFACHVPAQNIFAFGCEREREIVGWERLQQTIVIADATLIILTHQNVLNFSRRNWEI